MRSDQSGLCCVICIGMAFMWCHKQNTSHTIASGTNTQLPWRRDYMCSPWQPQPVVAFLFYTHIRALTLHPCVCLHSEIFVWLSGITKAFVHHQRLEGAWFSISTMFPCHILTAFLYRFWSVQRSYESLISSLAEGPLVFNYDALAGYNSCAFPCCFLH